MVDLMTEQIAGLYDPKAREFYIADWIPLATQKPVMAHELTHVKNRDVLVMTIASFFAMLAALLTRFGLYAGMFGGFGGGNRNNNNNQVPVWLIVFLVSIVVYAISFILIRTISRYREYAADRGSAIITGAPENLMSALQKISSGITQIPQRDLREVAGMNAFFIIPTNWKSQMSEWMMDHPPLEKRLAALSEIAREAARSRRLAKLALRSRARSECRTRRATC